MPDFKITFSDEQQRLMSEEYQKASIDWLRSKPGTLPPPFEQWLAERMVNSVGEAATNVREVEELRTVNAIEKLITRMQTHGFCLAHPGRHGIELPDAAEAFAQAVIADLGLSHGRVRRVRELLEYYSKSAKEVADLGHVTVTNRTYGALHEAWRELAERTGKARAHLGDDKALGRVEGAVAILVSLNVMSRQVAREKTEAFRQQERDQD